MCLSTVLLSGFPVFVLFLINLTQKGHLGKETSTEKMPPSDWPVGNPVKHFLV